MTSILSISWLKSRLYLSASVVIGFVKLGQPHPESNLSLELKSGFLLTIST